MKVTGYKLREALKQWALRQDAANTLFDSSLRAFEGEKKQTPEQVIADITKAGLAIAHLQMVQSRYNLYVTFEFEGRCMTLCEGVKSIGTLAIAEKLWRSASGKKKDRYSYGDNEDAVRDNTKVYATRVVSPQVAVEEAAKAAKRAGNLRAAIATANAQEVELDVNPEYFI